MMTRARLLSGMLGAAASVMLAPRFSWAASATAAAPTLAPAPAKEEAIARTVNVAFDRSDPHAGTFALEYFLRRPFDAEKPTVFVVGDGQQFFIRQDLAVDWGRRFGAGFNVVGLPGRGFAAEMKARLGLPSGDAWIAAYRFLRYERWTDDIDALRVHLLGERGKVALWGGSGGGYLVHQYLSRHGANAGHAYTEAAVNSLLDARFGFDSDRFWNEISAADRKILAGVLARDPERRDLYVQLLQRQNFFVDLDKRDAARHQLIADLAARREDVIAKARTDYQGDAIEEFMRGPLGAPIRVRLYEFYQPLSGRLGKDAVFSPDLENSALTARPLMELHAQGKIPAVTMDFRALHAIPTSVTMVAGFRDHTVDYRSQVALASHYPDGRLILLDDDHEFDRLYAIEGARDALVQGACAGHASAEYAAALKRVEPIIWREV